MAVVGYPREVSPGWLAPLLSYPGSIDVALHVEPVPNEEAAQNLRRQLARLESTRRIESKKERLADPELDTAASDAADLAGQIARGEGRLFRVGLYVTVRAPSEEALAGDVRRIKTLCASMLLDLRPVTFRSLQGWITTLPLATDAIRLRRNFDTRALAAAFPFANAELEGAGGILYGRNAVTGGLVFVNRFALENHNQVILARSGAGKSYLSKIQILRSLYAGIEVLVVDPENEYERLARAVGGTEVRLGAPGVRLNPLDLAAAGRPEALTEQALFVHTLVASLLHDLSSEERAALDRAILRAYERAGITADPRSHARPAPVLADVLGCLTELPEGRGLAGRLAPFVEGSYRRLFDGPSTVKPEGHLVVFSLRDLPDELKLPGTLIVLGAVWRRVTRGERRPRVVVVDEAWLLLRAGGEESARFMQRLAKSARKHWCGLTAITQDVADVIGTDLGQAVVTNASHQVLLGQSPQAIDALAKAFNLSEGEKGYLLTCDQGQGLLIIGTERAAVRVVASEQENSWSTSKPEELAAMEGIG
jgi:type IV secretory pathway VirB4 component